MLCIFVYSVLPPDPRSAECEDVLAIMALVTSQTRPATPSCSSTSAVMSQFHRAIPLLDQSSMQCIVRMQYEKSMR